MGAGCADLWMCAERVQKTFYLHLNGCVSISWLLTAAILPIWPHSIVSTVDDS